MKCPRGVYRDNQRGLALVTMLVLLAFLTMMIASVVKGNLVRRRYLQVRFNSTIALCLAESGVSEAAQALAGTQAGSASGRIGQGTFEVEWRPVTSETGVYEIISTGIACHDDPTSPRKRVTVRVRRDRLTKRLSVLSWRVE